MLDWTNNEKNLSNIASAHYAYGMFERLLVPTQ